MINQKYMSIRPVGWLAFGLAAAWALMTTANPFLTLLAIAAVPLFLILVWRRSEPPVLFFCLFSQWASVVTMLFKADGARQSLEDFSPVWGIAETTWISLVGLVVLALGMRLGMKGLATIPSKKLFDEVRGCSIEKVFFSYIFCYLISLILKGFFWMNPGAVQFFLAIFNLRWAFFFLLAYLTLSERKKRYYLLAAFLYEVSIGMISFFSEFKQPFFVLIIVYLTLGRTITVKRGLKVILLAVAVVGMGIIWSSVKPEYRDFINEGTGAQVATVPIGARINKIKDLYLSFDLESLASGSETLTNRLSYVEYFSMARYNVPRYMDYEKGKLLGNAVMHVLTPRILFPSKPIVDQTELTSRYTGINFARNTSVSLGYMAEYYIDFGFPFMYVPLLVLGCIWGLMYRYFLTHAKLKIFGFILATAVMINANDFGTNLVILVGSVTMNFLMMAVFMQTVLPVLVQWFSKSKGAR